MLSHWVHLKIYGRNLENKQFCFYKHLSKEAVEPAVAIKTTYLSFMNYQDWEWDFKLNRPSYLTFYFLIMFSNVW